MFDISTLKLLGNKTISLGSRCAISLEAFYYSLHGNETIKINIVADIKN
jgi:hypothetical protein